MRLSVTSFLHKSFSCCHCIAALYIVKGRCTLKANFMPFSHEDKWSSGKVLLSLQSTDAERNSLFMTFAESALNFVLVAAHHSIVRTCSIHKSKQDRGFFFIMYLKCQSDRISGPLIPASIDKLPFFVAGHKFSASITHWKTVTGFSYHGGTKQLASQHGWLVSTWAMILKQLLSDCYSQLLCNRF